MKKINKETLFDIIIPAAVTLAVLGILYIFFRPIVVSGRSMETNYHEGDKVIASTMADIDCGDVIVFNCKGLDRKLIKRVIAQEGDTVDIDFETGTVSVNGKTLDETEYTREITTLDEKGFKYPVTVPEGCYFVMGDNRQESVDSRSAKVGFVNRKTVIGKIVYKIGG